MLDISIPSFLRATVWLLFGVVFGFASILLIFASSAIFENKGTPVDIPHLVDPEFIIFLCVALMAGAGADYMLSVNFAKSKRLNVLLFILLITSASWFVLNPILSASEVVLLWFTTIVAVVTIVFCLWAKTVIFYKEEDAHKRLKGWL